ncbi:helix-turn-helix domain-containing protein [Neobacillus niacini]|uniref:helix-turn-helix domain-containing protein n=1 Tax=Neobacillus niacini TaxID=86668 RepID=UPI002FFEBDB5
MVKAAATAKSEGKVMLDVKDIMRLTGIGRDKAYCLLYSKQFPVKIIGRKMLVHQDIFDQWLKGKEYRVR